MPLRRGALSSDWSAYEQHGLSLPDLSQGGCVPGMAATDINIGNAPARIRSFRNALANAFF
jgi:hypothetical protein